MYDSDADRLVARRSKGPQRDVIGELAEAFREEGIVFGASSHRAEHWWFFDHGMYSTPTCAIRRTPRSTARPPISGPPRTRSEPPDEAFLDDWLLRSCEIVDKYQPQVVYFDWWICQPVFQPYLQAVRRLLLQPRRRVGQRRWRSTSRNGRAVVSRGHWRVRHRTRPIGRHPPDFWQTCTSVSKNSWGYVANHEYKEADSIVDDLIDIVQQERHAAAQHRPQAGRHDPGRGAEDAPRDRPVARRQRRSDLRHAAVETSSAKDRRKSSPARSPM